MTQHDDTPITPARVSALIDAYGAEPRRWPEAERDRALALLESRPELRQALQAARDLEGELAALPAAEPSGELMRRVAEIPLRHPRQQRVGLLQALGSLWRSAAAASVAGALGILVGVATMPETAEAEPNDWEEFSELAFGAELYEEEWEEGSHE